MSSRPRVSLQPPPSTRRKRGLLGSECASASRGPARPRVRTRGLQPDSAGPLVHRIPVGRCSCSPRTAPPLPLALHKAGLALGSGPPCLYRLGQLPYALQCGQAGPKRSPCHAVFLSSGAPAHAGQRHAHHASIPDGGGGGLAAWRRVSQGGSCAAVRALLMGRACRWGLVAALPHPHPSRQVRSPERPGREQQQVGGGCARGDGLHEG